MPGHLPRDVRETRLGRSSRRRQLGRLRTLSHHLELLDEHAFSCGRWSFAVDDGEDERTLLDMRLSQIQPGG